MSSQTKALSAVLSQQKLLELPSLDWYLYNNWSLKDILLTYIQDLRDFGKKENNRLELYHAQFLERYLGVIQNSVFIDTIQGDLEKKFMNEVAFHHPSCSFSLRGRVKSLYRLENKFNANIQSFIMDYYTKNEKFPSVSMIIKGLERIRDTIAYRFILQSKDENSSTDEELQHLVAIANSIPEYFDTKSLSPDSVGGYTLQRAPILRGTFSDNPSVLASHASPYYKDYVSNPKKSGFSAFTICMCHNVSLQVIELQLMTFDMFKKNEHNENSLHQRYEMLQAAERLAAKLPDTANANQNFQQAHERLRRLYAIDLTHIRVKMFHAFSKHEIEDFCGLVIGRQAKPVEYLF